MLVSLEDDSARLIDIDGDSLAISASGAIIVREILSHSFDEACHTLARRFEVDQERIRGDLTGLVANLERRNILIPPDGEIVRRPRTMRLPCGVSVPLLILCAQLPLHFIGAKAVLLQTVAFVSVRLWGWPTTMRTWMQTLERTRLRQTRDGQDAAALEAISRKIAHVIAFHVLPVSCKERALSGLFLSRVAGFDSRLIIGMNTMPFGLHCWCEFNGRVFADQQERYCESFAPVMVYS